MSFSKASTASMRLTKVLFVTRDEGKNYYEIGEFIRKKKTSFRSRPRMIKDTF